MGKKTIKLGEGGIVKPIVEKWITEFLQNFLEKSGEVEIELTGLKTKIGRIEVVFEGKVKARIRFLKE